MNRESLGKWISIFALASSAGWLLSLSSCARSQRLVGITVQPSGFTFLTPNSQAVGNFTALGSYIHPPETKDITALVTWKSDVQGLVTINAGAVSPAGNSCGVTNISASYDKGTGPSGNLVIGYATVIVDNPLVADCPGGSSAPVLAVVVKNQNTPTALVVSNPAGISCPGQSCGAPFASGTLITLTATPAASFSSWGGGCTSTTNVCQFVISGNTTVDANFQ